MVVGDAVNRDTVNCDALDEENGLNNSGACRQVRTLYGPSVTCVSFDLSFTNGLETALEGSRKIRSANSGTVVCLPKALI